MDVLTHLLLDYGYWGMLLSAFLAGSFFPFSSEAVMLGLLAAGLDPVLLLVYGSIGNVMGGMFNYGLGRLGKLEWLERYFHVKKTSIDRAYRFMGGHGAWMGFFCLSPNSRECHNDCAGTYTCQYSTVGSQYHNRESAALRCTYMGS